MKRYSELKFKDHMYYCPLKDWHTIIWNPFSRLVWWTCNQHTHIYYTKLTPIPLTHEIYCYLSIWHSILWQYFHIICVISQNNTKVTNIFKFATIHAQRVLAIKLSWNYTNNLKWLVLECILQHNLPRYIRNHHEDYSLHLLVLHKL